MYACTLLMTCMAIKLPGSSASKFSFRANFLNFFKCPTSGGKTLTRLPYKYSSSINGT